MTKTREVRQLKTKNSVALLPMPSALEPCLRSYLAKHYKPNPAGIALHESGWNALNEAGIIGAVCVKANPDKVGHTCKTTWAARFQARLATQLADASVPLPVLKQQLRHADVRTTLRI